MSVKFHAPLLTLPLRLAATGCTLQWTLGAEINKQLQLQH